jgi:acetylornithine deacetylase/succinyl-diaminopimelate desuccinylase-like protein
MRPLRLIPTRRAIAVLALVTPGTLLEAQSADPVAIARAYRDAHGPAILRDFVRLLGIPNVASDSANIRRNADELVRRLDARGIAARTLTLPGAPPLVYGRLDVPGTTRTLGIYVHYDGQPAGSGRWITPPWQPALYTRRADAGGTPQPLPMDGEPIDPAWRLYARSAGDDKAPFPALLAALDALREAGMAPTVNLVFLFEGEEEAGSPHLGKYFETYRALFDPVDLWLICDGPVHQTGRPQLVFGVRGVTALEVTVYGPNRPLHSGHYGNWAPVPGRLLSELIASMYDSAGNVTVAGFYDDVAPLDSGARAALAALPDQDAGLKAELGLAATEGTGRLEERLQLPALTVLGLRSADVGVEARNVIPSTATATLGVRLVAGNDPERMLELVEAHIRSRGFHLIRNDPDSATRARYPRIARVIREQGYRAARVPMDSPEARAVIAAARRAAGDDLLLVPGLGGSLPLYLFTETLGAPAVIVPIANHDDSQHAENENLRIGSLWYGVDLFAALLTMRAW